MGRDHPMATSQQYAIDCTAKGTSDFSAQIMTTIDNIVPSKIIMSRYARTHIMEADLKNCNAWLIQQQAKLASLLARRVQDDNTARAIKMWRQRIETSLKDIAELNDAIGELESRPR